MDYTLEDIRQLEIEMEIPAGTNFIDYVRQLVLLKEETDVFFGHLKQIILLSQELNSKG